MRDIAGRATAAWLAGDADELIRLMATRSIELWFAVPPEDLGRMISDLPPDRLRLSPEAALASRLLAPGLLQDPSGFSIGRREDLPPHLRRWMALVEGWQARLGGDLETAYEVLIGLPEITETDPTLVDPTRGVRSLFLNQAALTAALCGRFREALALYQRALCVQPVTDLTFLSREAHLRSALIHGIYGTPDAAVAHLTEAQRLVRSPSWVEPQFDAEQSFVEAFLREGEPERSFAELLQLTYGRMSEIWARSRVLSTFAGMRGAVSLAIALSVPAGTVAGGALDGRDEIVFVTAGVILLSLLVQGMLLPAIVRWARIPADQGEVEEYELAERTISGAALSALDDLAARYEVSDDVRDRIRFEGYQMLEYTNARTLAREQALVDAEVKALDEMLGQPDPLAAGTEPEADASGSEGISSGGVGSDGIGGEPIDRDEQGAVSGSAPRRTLIEGATLQMIATSEDVDLLQRSPLVRHEEFTRLKLALLDRKREVLLGLRRSGTVDDLVVRRISARLDLEQLRLQGLEELD